MTQTRRDLLALERQAKAVREILEFADDVCREVTEEIREEARRDYLAATEKARAK